MMTQDDIRIYTDCSIIRLDCLLIHAEQLQYHSTVVVRPVVFGVQLYGLVVTCDGLPILFKVVQYISLFNVCCGIGRGYFDGLVVTCDGLPILFKVVQYMSIVQRVISVPIIHIRHKWAL